MGRAITSRPVRAWALPEERGLYKKMKVRDILRFYGELKGCRDSKGAIQSWLERMGLTAWADKKVETLSKGMSQKIQFIAAIIHDPDLIILDEPFSGLDPVNMEVLREAVLDSRRRGATIIFSTHDMHIAQTMCDFVFMIFKGRKVLDGTLADIQNTYGQDTLRVKVLVHSLTFRKAYNSLSFFEESSPENSNRILRIFLLVG